MPMIPFAFHCISHRLIVGVGVVSILNRRQSDADVGAALTASAALLSKRQFNV